MSDRTWPPTHYLVMEVLAARHRLGHDHWSFPQNTRKAIAALAGMGFVEVWKDHDPAGAILAALTYEGRTAWALDVPSSYSVVSAAPITRELDAIVELHREDEDDAATLGRIVALADRLREGHGR